VVRKTLSPVAGIGTKAGVCRICHCTDTKPCRYLPNPHNPIGG
jgi:hypothetical protein